jgi:hypothetical protein
MEMDLETLMKYSRGDLPPKQFLAVHLDASELLELLNENLLSGEYLVSVADWPAVRKRTSLRQYTVLKTMMLITPLVVVGGLALAMNSPLAALLSGLLWLGAFAVIAVGLLLRRLKAAKSREGRSVVVVTDRRLIRVWLDGSGEMQSFALGEEKKTRFESEPVPETVRVLLRADLGKTSMN